MSANWIFSFVNPTSECLLSTHCGRQFDPRLEERQVAATLGLNEEPVYCRFVRQGIASGREQARADSYKKLIVR